MKYKYGVGFVSFLLCLLSVVIAEDKEIYDVTLSQEVAQKAGEIQDGVKKEVAALAESVRVEMDVVVEQLGSRDTRDKAYQSLLQQTNTVTAIYIDKYFTEKNIEIKRDLLNLLAKKSTKDNYNKVLAVIKRECFNKEERLRVGAINAMAAIIKAGSGNKGKEAWLQKEEIDGCLQFFGELLKSGGSTYSYWQRSLGQHLISFGRSDLVPEDMRRQLMSGPQT